ncbi:MAG: outer membrane lipoprotein-sorting protein [bacterium]
MKTAIKRLNRGLLTILILCLTFTTALMAETPEEKGQKIAEAVDALPTVEKMISESVMHIYDAQNQQIFSKQSRSATYMENFRDPKKRLRRAISYFFAPADDKGNGALMIEIPNDDDDQWLYLKGLRKPKRVVGSDKSSSFMGSDFSNGDVSARDIEDYNYTWLATETVNFKGKAITVEKVQSIFKSKQQREDYGYSKSIAWIHVSSGLVFKMEMYDLNGQLIKTGELQSFTIRKNEDDKKVFIVTGMEMKTVLKGTRTIMEMKNIKTGQEAADIKPDIFSVDYLTRRWW